MTFYERLLAETSIDRDRFLSLPLIRRVLMSGATKELYLAFLTQAYHHVKHTFPLLALAASRTTDESYQDALVEYMREERGHENWILDDIAAMGGDRDAVRLGRPGVACQVMVGYAYHSIERISPYAMLGSVHVLEGMSVLLADRVANVLAKSLGAGSGGFTYLRTHGALDVDHVAFFRNTIDRIDEGSAQELIVEESRVFYRLYGGIMEELDQSVELSHAA